jgi:CubicO group peptidase (beta-lactamase class C family)
LIASISKAFTAMSVMLLAQQGRLNLDDEVWEHVPEWADRGHRVTIRHMLGHASRVRDGFLLMGMAPPSEDGCRDGFSAYSTGAKNPKFEKTRRPF